MLLREMFEARGQSVGLIFGRFNPPHQGHRAAWEMASENDAWFVGTNQSTQGPKDPLPYDIKVKAMMAVWPEVKGHIVAETSWLTLASKIYKKYGDVKLNVYTDEDWVTKTIVQYNGKEGPHGLYKFSAINQVPTPRLSSATALRSAVQAGDKQAFSKAAGVDADTPVAGQPFFDLVASYLLPYGEKEKAKVSKKKEKATAEDAAGVGIITKQNTTADVNKGTLRKMMKAYHLTDNLEEAPIEMDPSEPMNPMIYGHDKANPAKLQYRMMRAEKQLADLADRAKNASPAEWQTISKHFSELSMNIEQIKHGLEELAKVRRKGGVRSRGIDPIIDNVEVDEISLGDYRKKAAMQKAQSGMSAMFAKDPEERDRQNKIFSKRERGLNRLRARDEKERKDAIARQLAKDIADLPELKAEYAAMRDEYKSLGGSDWQYADREQNLTDRERKARSMEGPMNNLWRQIQAAEKAQGQQGVAEGHGRYWCSTDKKWKTRKGPKQSRNN